MSGILRHPARRALALVVFGCLVLTCACGGGLVGSKGSNKSVTYALDSPILSLDPNAAAAAQDARVIRQMFDSLVFRGPDKVTRPWLASSWKISAGGTTYTFDLRSGVTFQDGTTFDAAAVCFNLNRIENPATASIFAIGAIGPYKSCAAPNATTAVVHLSEPYAAFLAYLSSPFLGMVSPTAVRRLGNDRFANHPVGTGPFTFVSYTPNDRIVMRANRSYNWPPAGSLHSGPPAIQTLTFQFITDPNTRVGSLKNGDVQVIGNVPEIQVASIEKNSQLQAYVRSQSGSPYQLNFNTAHKPLDDPAVRRALREALDVNAAIESQYFDVYQRAWGPLSFTTQDYDAAVAHSWTFDAKAAGRALDAAGWKKGSDGVRRKDGTKLSLTYVETAPDREKRQELAKLFAKNWKDIGVSVKTEFVQQAGAIAALQKGSYDVIGLSLVNPDPNVLYSLYDSTFRSATGKTGYNQTRVASSSLDSALLAAQQEQNPTKRAADYAALQLRLTGAAYSIPVYTPTYTVGATEKLKHLEFDSESYPIFYNATMGDGS